MNSKFKLLSLGAFLKTKLRLLSALQKVLLQTIKLLLLLKMHYMALRLLGRKITVTQHRLRHG